MEMCKGIIKQRWHGGRGEVSQTEWGRECKGRAEGGTEGGGDYLLF